jgi:hypothetical protein
MILQAFLDDSGSGKKEPFFALAGFISTVEAWAEFSNAWEKALAADPAIPYFKMSNAYAQRGVFNGWEREAIAKKVSLLTDVIKSHAMVRISSSMDRRAYDKYVSGNPPDGIDDPYFLCFYQVIYATALFQQKYGWNSQIKWVFDEQGKLGKMTVDWWHRFKGYARDDVKALIGSPPTFENDKKFMPLQAADLYAGALRRHLRDNAHLYLPKRKELLALQDIQSIERTFDPATLRNAKEVVSLGRS